MKWPRTTFTIFLFLFTHEKTLDVAAVCGDAGQFLPIDVFTGIG